jgi:hypothetical protein
MLELTILLVACCFCIVLSTDECLSGFDQKCCFLGEFESLMAVDIHLYSRWAYGGYVNRLQATL